MASGVIQNGSTLYYVDETTARSVTLTSGGYYNLGNTLTPAGTKIVSVGIIAWTSNSGAFSLVPYGERGAYAVGAPNVTIAGLRCRYWYTF